MKNKITISDRGIINFAKSIVKTEAEQVLLQKNHIDKNFVSAVKLLSSFQGKIVVLGVGKSGLIGRKLAATFSSLNLPSIFVHPVELLHGDLGAIQPQDIVIILSYSGETVEIKNILPVLKNFGIKIIAFTGKTNSRLARFADIVINTKIEKEACPYNIVPTSSTSAMLALGDALGITVAKLKGFKKEDFAKLHPSGSLGKLLNLKVKDIMRTGKNNPVVKTTASVKDALFIMTSTKVGATSVVDKNGKLVGYFTDGDLRRSLQKNEHLLNEKIVRVMTRKPKYIYEEELVITAKEMMEKYNCDNLPVVDKNKKVIGIIDERDILSEGL